jgi:hypothetical protein
MIKTFKLYESKSPDVEELKKAISDLLQYTTNTLTQDLRLRDIQSILFFGTLLDTFTSLSITPWGGSTEKNWYVLDGWGFSDDMMEDMELMAANLTDSIKRFKEYRKPTDKDLDRRIREREQYISTIRWDRYNLNKLIEEK